MFRTIVFIVFLNFIILQCTNAAEPMRRNRKPPLTSHGKCEPIRVPMCKDMPYNETIVPNLLNHQSQDDAGLELAQFIPIVGSQCSRVMPVFLCYFYVPVCTVLDEPIPPCRSICQQARIECEPTMKKFGFQWPDSLNCEKFPDKGLCVGEKVETTPTPTPGPVRGIPPVSPKPTIASPQVPVHPAHCSVCSLFGVPIVPYSPNLGEEDGCDIIQVGVDNFTHCERDKVRCSVKCGVEFQSLVNQVQTIVQQERRHLKKVWPCLTGVLQELKAIIVNVRMCHAHTVNPIIKGMHDKFVKTKWSTTRILEVMASEFKSVPVEAESSTAMDLHWWSPLIHYAYVLENVVITKLKHLQDNGQLKEMFGRKCYKKLTKPCI